MQRSNLFLFLAVILAIVVMTVWRLFAEELPAAPPSTPSGQDVPAAGTPASAASPRPDVPLPASAPRVVVEVDALERYVPPPQPRVHAVQLPARTPLPTRAVAGTGVNPWTEPDEVKKAGMVLVVVETESGRVARHVGVEATGVTELTFGSPLMVRGTVRDHREQPVTGARVWLGDLAPDGAPRELTTTADGAFETAVRASVGVPLVVRAEGFVSTWLPLQVDVDAPRDIPVVLRPGGVLEVQLAGRVEGVGAGQVLVSPTTSRSTELSRYPFFWQALFGGVPLDARGRVVVPGLAQRGAVNVTIAHPLIALGAHQQVTLDGERTTRTVQVAGASAWSGRVIDDAGEALPGATLLLRPGGGRVLARSSLLMLPPYLAAYGCLFTAAGRDGAFTLGVLREPGSVLSVRAPGYAGRDIAIGAGLPGVVTLPAWRGGELVLRLEPPAPGVAWRARIAVGDGLDLVCGPDEDAVVALPHAGTFDFRVATFVGQEMRGERDYPGVLATGPVVLQAPGIE